jgi:hypothetical protein
MNWHFANNFIDDVFQGTDRSLNVTLVNHFLRNSVTVTLQWPQEAGAVYHVSVSPEIPYSLLYSLMQRLLR